MLLEGMPQMQLKNRNYHPTRCRVPYFWSNLNIITNKMNYLSATYTNSTSFTNYDDVRFKQQLVECKNKYFGWQLNVGQNYRESAVWTSLEKQENGMNSLLSNTKCR
jgi:hypothetical protein